MGSHLMKKDVHKHMARYGKHCGANVKHHQTNSIKQLFFTDGNYMRTKSRLRDVLTTVTVLTMRKQT